MPISKPTLPPRKGYVEVEINGVRQYSPVDPPVPAPVDPDPVQTDIDLMADAYREGVNES